MEYTGGSGASGSGEVVWMLRWSGDAGVMWSSERRGIILMSYLSLFSIDEETRKRTSEKVDEGVSDREAQAVSCWIVRSSVRLASLGCSSFSSAFSFFSLLFSLFLLFSFFI